ncbi:hypothetical protein HDV03_001469, partial [Kappamyces sp. JEL0829]
MEPELIRRKSSTSVAPRRIHVNTPPSKSYFYTANEVRTSKYTLLSFLPKNIFEQFHGLANFYFLGVIILQAFPQFSQVNIIIPTLPLVIIVAATALKDGLEDLKRHSADESVNKSPAYTLEGWKNVNVQARKDTVDLLTLVEQCMASFFRSIFRLIFFFAPSPAKDDPKETYPDHLDPKDYILRSSVVTSPLDRGSWLLSQWSNIQVGDFILLRNNDRIPADVIVISTGEPDGMCYIETKNLDGETNLKVKRGIKELSHITGPEDCKSLKCYLDAEAPNPNLYTFNGALNVDNKVVPIGPSGLLLRGCILRNTSWLIALVVYTGSDTKIMLNSGPTPSKRSRVDKQINPLVVLNAFALILLSLVCAICSGLYTGSFNFELAAFVGVKVIDFPATYSNAFIAFFNCLIVFQNIIPIALYISLEITKAAQSYLIHVDDAMYDEEADQSVNPKAWNLCDDLGQIEYVFSDKTGTLTSNMMDFRKASIGGVIYGKWIDPSIPTGTEEKDKEALFRERDLMISRLGLLFDTKFLDSNPGFIDSQLPLDLQGDDDQSKRIKGFFSVLAICHTVLVEKPNELNPYNIHYRAQSPDEAALVTAAKNVGFSCLQRNENRVDIDFMGTTRTYTILNIIEFNSDRKRMSVIALRPEGDIILMCKGADSVIYERLNIEESASVMNVTSAHLATFANEGLRTLCLAFRRISKEDYEEWNTKYRIAQAAIEDREKKCDEVADLIEKDLILIGATAIEDKLQEGVPESIALLAKAGIKLWVLTGDKVET